jgi:NADH:ubiquinone oxidoreductase subunit E
MSSAALDNPACNPAKAQPADLTLALLRERMAKHQPQIEELWRRYPVKRAVLLQVLWLAQQELGWVPRVAIEWAAEVAAVSPAHAYGVVEFYTMYKQVPTGRHLVQVCQTMCCLLQGGEDLIAHLERKLGVHCGETTADGLFTLVRVECLALCGTGPGVMIDDQAIGPEPHALGANAADGVLTERYLERDDFHPTPAALDRWLDFLKSQPAPKQQVHSAIGAILLNTKGHPQGTGATAKPLSATYAPAAPALKLAAVATGDKIALTWVNDPAAVKVVVERSDDGGSTWRELATLTGKDQKAADTLPEGKTAHYRVLAHEKDRLAKPSAVVSATGKPPPPPAPAPAAAPGKA